MYRNLLLPQPPVMQSYLQVFKRVNVVLPNCPLVSTLISPLNYFPDYTHVIGIYTSVESTPGEAKRSHLFTLAFYFNQPALSSFCLELLLFTYLLFLLLSPVYTRKEKGQKEIIRFQLPHPFNVASGWRKRLFLGLSCICFSPPAAAATLSLSDLFSMFLPWKVVPLSVPARMMLGYFGMMSLWLQVVGQEKIPEPPKVMGEVIGSSLDKDWMIRNPAPLPQLLHFPLLVLSDGEPRTPDCPHTSKTSSAPDICLPHVSMGQFFMLF